MNFRELLAQFEQVHGHPLKSIRHRHPGNKAPDGMTCPHCEAPAPFLYFNDGKLRSQLRCKVCALLSQAPARSKFRETKTKYWCPYCSHALFRWKQQALCTIYKCDNDKCPTYLKALAKLNAKERELRKTKSSQFKLRYQYREYHFNKEHLLHAAPDSSKVDLDKIYNAPNVLGLVLTFHVSFALAARKTAQILKQVFRIPISYQTVLNYAEAAAPYCHHFNFNCKGEIDDDSAGDETYIKIDGKHAYTFFFISTPNHKITAYHVADSRATLPATVAMKEAIRTQKSNQAITLITDGNPAYPAGIHFLNQNRDQDNQIDHRKVIGLQNLDEESALNRHFKQIIERLNRTYKQHIRAANGFKATNGALALTTLFVTHYNFLRPHMALGYKVPIPIAEISPLETIQAKWCKIIEVARQTTPVFGLTKP
ncbi:MAG: transposase [bacterium]